MPVKATERATDRTEARAEIVDALAPVIGQDDRWRSIAIDSFAACYNGAASPLPPLRAVLDRIPIPARAAVPTVSTRSLRRWLQRRRAGGRAALADRYGNRKGSGRIDRDKELGDTIIGLLQRWPHADAPRLLEALALKFGDPARLPSLRVLQLWLARFKRERPDLYLALRAPDAWKGRYMAAFGDAAERVERLNQEWELDSTPGDVLLEDGRHTLIGVIDIYSRRLILHLAKTSSSAGVAAAIRRAILAWGVPELVRTDEGKDYVSRHLRRGLSLLDLDHDRCAPFSPWQKPFIERVLGSFNHDLLPLLDAYTGHDVAARQALREQRSFADRLMKPGGETEIRMTSADFRALADKWCAAYELRPHDGLDGASPALRAAGYAGPVARVENERALDVLLAAAPGGDGIRVVTKKGVRVDRRHYIAAELGPLVGRRVAVTYDEADLGRIYCREPGTGDFICVAVAPDIAGVSRRDIAQAATRLQRRHINAERKALKAKAKKAADAEIAERILEQRFRDTANVTPFPRPVTAHETPALESAAAMLDAAEPARPSDLDTDNRARAAAELARLEAGPRGYMAQASRPRLAVSDGAPIFADDREWAAWVIDNPDRASVADRARLAEKLRRPEFRLLLDLDEAAARRLTAG